MLHLIAASLIAPAPHVLEEEVLPPPVVQWYGPTSEIREPGFHLVDDATAWRDLWTRHMGDDAVRAEQGWVQAPEVDFERHQVVACFRGDAWNANGERVVSITTDGIFLRIRYDTITYQTAGPDGGGVECAPYGLWVIPRHDKRTLVIEENTQGLIGGEPIWTKRFEKRRHW